MRIEYAQLSLVGHREDNQDRVSVTADEQAAILVVLDGMGGHAEGARAAEVALKSILDSFWNTPRPVFDPLGFLHLSLGRAHSEVAALGAKLSVETRPRATGAVCLVQEGSAYWAHVGDSRVYHIRGGAVTERTRDHSHVEQLLREGMITEDEVAGHPMRNFVECCLGGDAALPEMSVNTRRVLKPDDILLLCTDGVWANLKDAHIAGFYPAEGQDLTGAATKLAERAVQASAPYSDNSTLAVLRFLAR